MEPFSYHVFFCTQQKLEDKPFCSDRGGEAVLDELLRLIHVHHLEDKVQVTPCGCLGLCSRGPNLVVYPEGTWYSGLTVESVAEIVSSHFISGQPVERLAASDSEAMRQEILEQTARGRREELARQEAGVLPDRLRRLADGFRASRTFLSAVELDLFSAVGDGADLPAVADQLGTAPRSIEMLLNALTAMGLLVKREGRYYNSTDASRYLRRGLPDDARAALIHRVLMWDQWSTLTESVREGNAMRLENNLGPSSTQAYLAATHKIATLAASTLVSSLGPTQVKRVLDVGGGSGAYTVAVLNAFPAATAQILDLEPVLRITGRYIREAGLEERIQLRAGDFTLDPLGSDFDLVLLSYVVHLNPLDTAERLLRKVFEALEPGGRVVINDYILNNEKVLPRQATLQALNLLVSTRGGNVYSEAEVGGVLESAGFVSVKRVPLLGPTDLITALKP